jgi:probable phosphoglycerate mutase
LSAIPFACLLVAHGGYAICEHEEIRSRWPDELQASFDAPDMALIPDGEMLAVVLVRAINFFRMFFIRKVARQ